MKSDDEIKRDWQQLETENIEKACELLRQHESRIEDYIADIVASLCNVDCTEMLTNSSTAYLAQARWLYWYAIRYMTNETYDKIALRTTAKSGCSFTPNGIGQSINKMALLVAQEPIWIKRWTIIKHIIKLRDANQQDFVPQETVTMRVIAPKNIKVEIKTDNLIK